MCSPVPSEDFREDDNEVDELDDIDDELEGFRRRRLTLRLKLANSPIYSRTMTRRYHLLVHRCL